MQSSSELELGIIKKIPKSKSSGFNSLALNLVNVQNEERKIKIKIYNSRKSHRQLTILENKMKEEEET